MPSPPTCIISAKSNRGERDFCLPWTGSLSHAALQLCQTSKMKARQSLFRLQRTNLENCSQCPHQEKESQDQKAACHKKTPYQFALPPQRSRRVLSFPSSPPNLVGSKPCMGIQAPSRHLDSCFRCHRTGRLPSGSLSQEASHSCWSLVTPYPGGGSISMLKQ